MRGGSVSFVLVAALCVGVGLACRGGGGSDGTAAGPTTTAATPPEEALRLYVQRRLGQDFVQNCDDAERPGDVGKQCARFRGERNGLLAYELGPTFSEFTRLIILERAAGSWTIAHLETHDPSAPPIPGIPWPIEVGATVVVAGTDDCLRIRERPGVLAPQVNCLDDGTVLTIEDGPVEADDFEWWRIGDGWAAGPWLRYAEDAPATPAGEAP